MDRVRVQVAIGHAEGSESRHACASVQPKGHRSSIASMPDDDRDQPVTLAPLTPEEALRALLAVKPDRSPTDDQSGDDSASK